MSVAFIGTEIKYPVLDVILSDPATGKAWLYGPCCFQDIFSSDDFELAGMGLAIIGNICQGIRNGNILMRYDALIQARTADGAEPIPLPWPGMPDDRPLKLDLAQMPFDPVMFLDTSDYQFKTRPDRLAMLDRIQAIWVPCLKAKLVFSRVLA